jgi:transcriptional regulator with XRE-family HTH domain
MKKILSLFGKHLKQLRKNRNWTQQELANRSGLHKNYIGMVERGERNPSLINLSKIAKALDIELVELVAFN